MLAITPSVPGINQNTHCRRSTALSISPPNTPSFPGAPARGFHWDKEAESEHRKRRAGGKGRGESVHSALYTPARGCVQRGLSAAGRFRGSFSESGGSVLNRSSPLMSQRPREEAGTTGAEREDAPTLPLINRGLLKSQRGATSSSRSGWPGSGAPTPGLPYRGRGCRGRGTLGRVGTYRRSESG